ncbi:MAG: hypothetical protein ACRC57_03440 [Sarcina sp.]
MEKKHKYTLIENDNEVKEKTEKIKNLVESHNNEKNNLETVLLTLDKKGTNFVGNRTIDMNDIIGTSRVDLEHLTWKDSLIFLQKFTSFLPLEDVNVAKFLEKMETNDFVETLKLIEYPRNSKKYYILDGTNRIVFAKNLGLEVIKAEIYSE